MGGGHSTAGASSTNGGLLIDLNTHLRHFGVDITKRIAKVGGGATWGNVDSALGKYGLATVGGGVADTGVGGLSFRGGFGWLAVKHGLVIDNLLECTVVLADGSIVKASASENGDLFWALRGAGQNFCVGIEFIFQAHEQGDMWAGFLLFSPMPEFITKAVEASNEIYMPDEQGRRKVYGCASAGLGFVKPAEAGHATMFYVG
jgi:FAD/FMN-containing dehydrogenase